jgi:AcrR family transcriptional regulator
MFTAVASIRLASHAGHAGTSMSRGEGGRGGRCAGEERRQRILVEATRCFAARGFAGTTTRELAAGAGVTEAALYRYFPSKEALYTALIDEKMATPSPFAALEEAALQGERHLLEQVAVRMLEASDADPHLLRILLYTALEGHALADSFMQKRVYALRGFLTEYFASRMRAGAFRALDPALAARGFLGMLVHYLLSRDVLGQSELRASADEIARTFTSLFLDGIRPRDAGASNG